MLQLDRQLWRLVHNDISTLRLALQFLAITTAIAVLLWLILERRSRWIWRGIEDPSSAKAVRGVGPYRATSVPTFFEKAPLQIRVTSLVGIIVGIVGIVWPALIIADIPGGTSVIVALLFEAIGALCALLSIISAIAMLRGHQPFKSRERKVIIVAAALLAALSAAHLAHLFDDAVTVNAYGIKWHETMTLGRFLLSGFTGIVGGHVGYTWRVLLRSSAIFGLMSAGYFMLWANLIAKRGQLHSVQEEQEDQQEEEKQNEEGDVRSKERVRRLPAPTAL